MKLSKFFRRYSRVLLMVFMSLLLVAFLLDDVLRTLGRGLGNPKWRIGRAFDRDITNMDLQVAQANQTFLLQIDPRDDGLFRDVGILDPLYYYLLTEEARRVGVRSGPERVKALLAQVPGIENRLAALQRSTGRSYEWMYARVGEWLAVLELMAVQGDAVGDSLPRAELTFRDQRQEAEITLAVLDAKAFVSFVPEPTEEELQKFFEQTKAQETSHTEAELKFGYVRPDRVRIEYLTVDPKVNAARVRPREKDVQAFFEDHRANYTKPARPPDTQATQPASAPIQVPMSYEEARERVREDYRMDRATRDAQALVDEMRQEANRPWQAAPRDATGMRTPPPAEAIVAFESLRDRFKDRADIIYVKTDLLSQAELSTRFEPFPEALRRQIQMGSREPMYHEGRIRIPLSELALRVQGLLSADPKDPRPVLNLREPSPVLISTPSSPQRQSAPGPSQAYFFQVVEVVPKGPPESLDAVRERVVADYKLMRAHELAGNHAKELLARAEQEGLAAAVEGATALKDALRRAEEAAQPPGPPPGVALPSGPQYLKTLGPNPATVTRESEQVAGIGRTDGVPREAFVLVDRRAAGTAPASRAAQVQVAGQFKWAVIELANVKPLYEGEFARDRISLLKQSVGEERTSLLWAWIIPQNVHLRTGFTPERAAAAPEQTGP